jgi:hypothetical protein
MEGNLKDSVTGAEGTLKNGASFVNDAERGSVLYLNNDSVVSPGDTANGELGYDKEGQWAELAAPYIPDSDQMTISIWFKAAELRTWARAIDLGDAKAQNALANGETATVGPDRFINISPTNGSNTIGTFNENDSTEGISNNRDRVFADLVDENVWVHAVFVIDAASGNPDVLYINGTPFESSHGNAGDDPEPAVFSPKDILASPEGVRNAFLGRSAYENNTDQIFNGYIDDVAIFDVALTADQVAELDKADFKNGNPAAVIAPAPDTAQPAEAAPVVDAAAPQTPAPAPDVSAANVSPAPQTGDSIPMLIILTAVSLIGAVIFVRLKRTNI